MTNNLGRLPLVALLLLSTCSSSSVNIAQSNTSNVAGNHRQGGLRIRVNATYDAALLPEYLNVTIRNEETYPICFPRNDILPGSETTNVRDADGHPLSGSSDEALEEFHGVNVAGPIVVLRPGGNHSELIAIEQGYLNRPAIIFQIGFGAFPCRELFDGRSTDVRPVFFQNVFRMENGRIYEQPELRFEVGEEPPTRR